MSRESRPRSRRTWVMFVAAVGGGVWLCDWGTGRASLTGLPRFLVACGTGAVGLVIGIVRDRRDLRRVQEANR